MSEEFGQDGGYEFVLPSLASSELENWHPVRGLSGQGLGESASARGPRRGGELLVFRLRPRRKASGESENLLRPRGFIFTRPKQYFLFLLRVPLLAVSDK